MTLEPGFYYLAKSGQVFGPLIREELEPHDIVFVDEHTTQAFYEDGTCWSDPESNLVHKIIELKLEG